MPTTKIPLDQISVASPCTVPWGGMVGDDVARFCGQRQRHVYNLSEMTREEAETFVMAREGRLCVRFYRRFDGTMMTKDCPVGWRALKRRAALVGAAVGAVLVAGLGIVTLGTFAATRENRAAGGWNPINRVRNWLFPPPPPLVMGKFCPPIREIMPPVAPLPIEDR
jgi:hypothetical protein